MNFEVQNDTRPPTTSNGNQQCVDLNTMNVWYVINARILSNELFQMSKEPHGIKSKRNKRLFSLHTTDNETQKSVMKFCCVIFLVEFFSPQQEAEMRLLTFNDELSEWPVNARLERPFCQTVLVLCFELDF
jgi:hypothetical protein